MSAEQQREPWMAPQSFRDALDDLVTISDRLLEELDGQMVIPVADIAFLGCRINRLAENVRRALPPEVS